jgi:hypothetical protein
MENSQPDRRQSHDLLILALLGGAVALLHILANGAYGFHRDELDILMNARRLAWGYVAYPPLTPSIARIGLELFGDSLRGLRLFSALGQGIVFVLAGWMARDMGGRRAAQILAALAVALAPAALTAGTLIQYMSFDYLLWVLVAFFVVRLLRTENPRYWLGVGAAIGLGMLTKYTIVFFIAGLAGAVLLTRLRRSLRSPWLWAGAGLALLLVAPNLVWQAQNGFISLEYLTSIHARDIQWGRADEFLLDQLYIANNPFLLPLWLAGLYFCFFHAEGKRFRPLGWMYLVTVILLWAMRGRGYYPAPAYAMLMSAGAVWWEGWLAARQQITRRIAWGATWAVVFIAGTAGAILVKPVVPVSSALWETVIEINGEAREMIGWRELVQQVAEIYAGIPEEERAVTAVLAGNYGEAGALDFYQGEYDLPPMISGANSLWERGYGNPEPQTAIVVGFESGYALNFFKTCQTAGKVSNPYGVKNEETLRHNTIYVCREPRRERTHAAQGCDAEHRSQERRTPWFQRSALERVRLRSAPRADPRGVRLRRGASQPGA